MLENKVITRNALLTEIKSWPREHAREEGFKSISSNATSICHKTSVKLFPVIDKLYLVHCFKICFSYVLPVPTESNVNWSKNVFVRRNCKELWGNLRRWYLVNEHEGILLGVAHSAIRLILSFLDRKPLSFSPTDRNRLYGRKRIAITIF